MKDFDIIIDRIMTNTEQIEEDMIRAQMELEPKESEVE